MISAEEIEAARIIPVLTATSVDQAVDAARALEAGGISCVEMTLRTPVGVDAIAAIASATTLLVGAGTVLTRRDIDLVREAGARFVVSPGFDETLVAHARASDLLAFPGVATPSEVQAASSVGADVVKLFPADLLGGPRAIRALSAPFPHMRFIPSGGVNDANARVYLDDAAVFAVSGSWVLPAGSVEQHDSEAITTATRAALLALGEEPTA